MPIRRQRRPLSSNEKIDICRGLFAFLVVAAHAVDISWVIHPEVPGRFPGWLHDVLLYVVAAGVYWVIGFFVISGYCIQLSVERQIKGNDVSSSAITCWPGCPASCRSITWHSCWPWSSSGSWPPRGRPAGLRA